MRRKTFGDTHVFDKEDTCKKRTLFVCWLVA